MSVECSAIYGYGYIIHADEAANMDEEKFEALIDSPYCLCVDCYDTMDYFFGLRLAVVSPGNIIMLPTEDNYKPKELIEMIREFKSYFPDKDAFTIRHCLINQFH